MSKLIILIFGSVLFLTYCTIVDARMGAVGRSHSSNNKDKDKMSRQETDQENRDQNNENSEGKHFLNY